MLPLLVFVGEPSTAIAFGSAQGDPMTAPLFGCSRISIAFSHAGRHGIGRRRQGLVSLQAGCMLALRANWFGKSVTALSIVRPLAANASHPSGAVLFNGEDILHAW